MSKMTKEALQEKVARELAKSKKMAEREITKIKDHVSGKLREAERYIEKNPEKTALISAGIGAALGAAMALFMSKGTKKKR